MKPRERLSAHECLKRSKTDLFTNDILDIGGATQTEKTALWGEIANRKSSITVMAEALQSQKSAHLSKTILQKTAPQHNVADDNSSPSHQDEGVLRGRKISNFEDDGNLESDFGEKDGKSNKQLAGCPITNGSQATVLQSQKPIHFSKTILQRTALQNNVADDNGSPTHQDEGILRSRQKTSNLDDDGNLKSALGEKDGKINEQLARYPITHGGQASVKKRDITTESSPDRDSHRSKRRRKSTGPTNPSKRPS